MLNFRERKPRPLFFLRGSLFFLAGLIGESTAVASCHFIEQSNGKLADHLGQLKLSLTQFEQSMLSMEQACQREQSVFAAKSAAAATAESCVALKESAAMNQRLSTSSRTCATQIQQVHRNIDILNQLHLGPFASDMDSIKDRYKGAESYLPHCANAFREGNSMRDQTHATLQRSYAAVAKGKKDEAHFTALSAQTGQFAQTSQAAVNRCVGEVQPLVAGAAGPTGGMNVPPVPGGQHPQDESTVTGKIGNETLASLVGNGSAGSASPGAVSAAAISAGGVQTSSAVQGQVGSVSTGGGQVAVGAGNGAGAPGASSAVGGSGTAGASGASSDDREAISVFRKSFAVQMDGRNLLDEPMPVDGDKNFILEMARGSPEQRSPASVGAGDQPGEQVSIFKRVSRKIHQRAAMIAGGH